MNKENHLVLRDEIATCPNMKIDIDVTDRTPFFSRPYHVREEDKRILFDVDFSFC